MLHGKRWMAAILVVAGLGLTGCTESSQTDGGQRAEPAKISVDSSGAKQVTLTQEAADRLAIQSVPVQEASVPPRTPGGPTTTRKVVPYAALLYDVNGDTWVYASPKSLTFVRQRVTVDYVTGDLGVLSDGPPLGTAVVTKGTPELYGTEFNIGEPGHGE
jgi:hypothetical protein